MQTHFTIPSHHIVNIHRATLFVVKEDANQSWHSLISLSSSVGSAVESCKDFCKCNNYFVARVAGNMRDYREVKIKPLRWIRPPWMRGQHSRSRSLRLIRCAKWRMPSAVIKLLLRKLSDVRFPNPEKTHPEFRDFLTCKEYCPFAEMKNVCIRFNWTMGCFF